MTNATVEMPSKMLGAARDFSGTIESGGIVRSYQMHVPARKASQALPLVLVLHGGGGDGTGMQSLTGMDSSADAAGFIVVYPDGWQKMGRWSWYDRT